MAVNFELWIVSMADRTPDMWGPGIVALVLTLEGLRKAAGKVIAGLVWLLIGYAYFGNFLPGVLEAEVFPPTKTVLYLYADNNGVPGIVLRVVTELVLAFIVFGKLLQVSGATAFFNYGHELDGPRRGGPAKVAALRPAPSTISGRPWANVTGSSPAMMKKAGFRPQHAGAIEAVASNGGQIAPPVMGPSLSPSSWKFPSSRRVPAVLFCRPVPPGGRACGPLRHPGRAARDPAESAADPGRPGCSSPRSAS